MVLVRQSELFLYNPYTIYLVLQLKFSVLLNFTLNRTQGKVGVSPQKKKQEIFREAHFHSVNTQTQAVVTIFFHCMAFLLPFNGNSNVYNEFASKLTAIAIILRYNFSLSDCYFSLIFLEGEVTSSYCQGLRTQLEPCIL